MTEEQLRKAKAQMREFPETLEIMDRLRNALASKLFETPINASVEREAIYLRVQTLDAMRGEMLALLNAHNANEAFDDYAKQFATTA